MTQIKKHNHEIAYFSAEIGISPNIPTYSGGLGVLAGDHIKAAADKGINMCAITLLYKEGYYKQHLNEQGEQSETYPKFDPFPMLEKENIDNFSIPLQNRDVYIDVYRLDYNGIENHCIPIYFLDTDNNKNNKEDRNISLRLYSGNKDHRILQEAVLGFGGIRLLEKLNINNIKTYHMNEGHCSFLVLELLSKLKNHNKVKELCHFTTHTPVPAGHDEFSMERCKKILNNLIPKSSEISIFENNRLHMTKLGLNFSRSANGVSKLHQKVAQEQFPDHEINYITNGVHHSHWICTPYQDIFNKYLPNWKKNPLELLNIEKISNDKLMDEHQHMKDRLLLYANSQTSKALDNKILTIGFARRAATYKRINLIFNDLEKLINIAEHKIQIIFSGKAHPKDEGGKELIKEVFLNAHKLEGKIKVIYLDNYNMWLGKLITSGVDVWLNTPLRPNEASGTSGMKAALNGVPNLSILDGWWEEGCKDNINGWAIGNDSNSDDINDANQLYDILKNKVIPTFYNNKKAWAQLMKESIKSATNFTALRMIEEYNEKFYNK
tara:strand:+ start:4612 stop:6264 length:1653 start_codon:yes stop_codon:yes gene_type:complete